MKKVWRAAFACMLILALATGCGKSSGVTGRGNKNKSVDSVLKSQVEKENQASGTIDQQEASKENVEEAQNKNETAKRDGSNKVDIDLTQMGSDMVYATVYQLMSKPEDYIGQRIRIRGSYFPYYDETTKQNYHNCLIRDAAACCSQGIEFIWEDGSHKLEEYPKEDSEIVVEGIYETYKEGENMYSRLRNASLSVEKGNE
ncbi:hypothetical protein [[Clostridium] polysaccharolyticum]|uniref:Lipoprotein n=1 Tax=[Clostridium] polysaccharolyticum TaxID=29364 RepID=A0A1I0DHK7_9FIRM|nr:hypothetical protein [[Clostridium] polysaccharolyticum]SET31132.1 hypothetical protein SAMN04487772_11452 [[Clostridium] polysaccharolyticum]